MLSQLIITNSENALKEAKKIAPIDIKDSIDCQIFQGEDSLKISQVRDIKKFLQKKPYQEDFQVIYIEAAHRLTIPAQNSLLKTLEEPPNHAQIILTTPYPDKLLPTIISRCNIVEIKSENKKEERNFEEIDLLFNKISQKNPGERVNLAQSYAYPKTKAQSFLEDVIDYSRRKFHQTKEGRFATNAGIAQTTLKRIKANIDPKLSLEHFFLKTV